MINNIEENYIPKSCKKCKIKANYNAKFMYNFNWNIDSCPFKEDCIYRNNIIEEFNNSGFSNRELFLEAKEKKITFNKPSKGANIITLYDLINKFLHIYNEKHLNTKTIYYLVDLNGYETELVILEYNWLIDKFKENPKYKVSCYYK